MIRTIKPPIKPIEEIKEMQKLQSSMVRCAYKAASLGLAEISVREEVRNRFEDAVLDSWFQQSAVKCGMGMFNADFETDRKTRIFGGKKQFIRRVKGLISNEEWKQSRLLPLYIIGESPRAGNRKFEFFQDYVIFKPSRGIKIRIDLPKMRNNIRRLWERAVQLADVSKLPITVSLTSSSIAFAFDQDICEDRNLKYKKSISTRFAGIDLNPNYIGVSVFDGEEKLVATKLFNLRQLTGKYSSSNKLLHETIEIGHEIGRFLKFHQVDKLFIEELSFKQGNKELGRNFNRLTINNWKRNKLKSILEKYYPKLMEINCAYTSTIGNVLNPRLPDPVAASTEIARRGHRITRQKKSDRQFYPPVPSSTYLQDLWKETEIPEVTSWVELHNWLKINPELRYRIPIPTDGFQKFSSTRSRVTWLTC